MLFYVHDFQLPHERRSTVKVVLTPSHEPTLDIPRTHVVGGSLKSTKGLARSNVPYDDPPTDHYSQQASHRNAGANSTMSPPIDSEEPARGQ